MKHFSIVTVVSTLSLSLLVGACNSGGSRRTVGKQCPANYNPISKTAGANQTVLSLDPAQKQLMPGLYKYVGATAYYKDKGSNFRIEITDVADPKKAGDFKPVTSCVRNAKPGLNIAFELSGVSKMEVAADHKTFYDTRKYNMVANGAGLKVSGGAKQQKVEGSPKDAYNGISVPGPMLIKKNANDFEIRSFGEDAAGEYSLVVRLKRENNPATPPPAAKR